MSRGSASRPANVGSVMSKSSPVVHRCDTSAARTDNASGGNARVICDESFAQSAYTRVVRPAHTIKKTKRYITV